ncbi:S49 family peptidase [Limoniibacter endophyticus]|uniref:Peptidase S49 n=1 Tax=Limoniibacter endophyticus TaxID=1565040 RepID=A0A8J3GGX9_9HYPH|nr:S49 family peptidase [Limoniibacter endophyticus]GHC71331.1 peptidase S49 [Limoniibacter endophyticus]
MKKLVKRFLPRSMRGEEVTIPVVRLEGAIMSGGNRLRPSLSMASVAPLLERAFAYKGAPAIALAINSPGGSPVQSRLIYQRIRDLALEKNKAVYVFVEDVAASGGYMLALAGDEIIADPSSIVGSIGVISASFGFQNALSKLGIERRVHTSGENKSILDPFSPEKAEDVEHLKALQADIHQTFINMVKERRGAKLAQDPDLFTGLFWTGEKTRTLGLVDDFGTMRGFLKARYGSRTELKLITEKRGLFGRRLGVSTGFGTAVADGLISAAEERALWNRYGL